MDRKTGFELKQLDEKGQFVARIARLNAIDKDLDVALPGAFGNGQVAPVVIGHRWDMVPVGKVGITEEGDEVLARGKLNLGMGAGRALYEALRFDAANPPKTSQFSYAFSLEDFEHGAFEGRRVRFLRKLKVHEISAVLVGAGDTALLAVKENLSERTAELVQNFERLRERGVVLDFLELRARPVPGSVGYKILPHHEVREDRSLAVSLASEACKALGIGMAAGVEIVREARDGETPDFYNEPMGGCADLAARKIYLIHDLRGLEWAEVAGHEVAHLKGLGEEEAARFGKSFAGRYRTESGAAPRHGPGPKSGRSAGLREEDYEIASSSRPSVEWERAAASLQALRNLAVI